MATQSDIRKWMENEITITADYHTPKGIELVEDLARDCFEYFYIEQYPRIRLNSREQIPGEYLETAMIVAREYNKKYYVRH